MLKRDHQMLGLQLHVRMWVEWVRELVVDRRHGVAINCRVVVWYVGCDVLRCAMQTRRRLHRSCPLCSRLLTAWC